MLAAGALAAAVAASDMAFCEVGKVARVPKSAGMLTVSASVCCPATCERCGGVDCWAQAGGNDCCTKYIYSSGIECSSSEQTSCILPKAEHEPRTEVSKQQPQCFDLFSAMYPQEKDDWKGRSCKFKVQWNQCESFVAECMCSCGYCEPANGCDPHAPGALTAPASGGRGGSSASTATLVPTSVYPRIPQRSPAGVPTLGLSVPPPPPPRPSRVTRPRSSPPPTVPPPSPLPPGETELIRRPPPPMPAPPDSADGPEEGTAWRMGDDGLTPPPPSPNSPPTRDTADGAFGARPKGTGAGGWTPDSSASRPLSLVAHAVAHAVPGLSDGTAETLLAVLLTGLASVALFLSTVALCARAGREDAPLLLRACSHALCGSIFMRDSGGGASGGGSGSQYAKVRREDDVESDGLLGRMISARGTAQADPRRAAPSRLSHDRRLAVVSLDDIECQGTPGRVARLSDGDFTPRGRGGSFGEYAAGLLSSGGLGGLDGRAAMAVEEMDGQTPSIGEDWTPSEASACRADREAEAARLAFEIGPEDSISVAWMQRDPELAQLYHRPPPPYQPQQHNAHAPQPPAKPHASTLPLPNPARCPSHGIAGSPADKAKLPQAEMPSASGAASTAAGSVTCAACNTGLRAGGRAAPSFVVGPASGAAPGSKPVTMETPDGTRHAMCADLESVDSVAELERGMLAAYRDLHGIALPASALRIHARMGLGARK